MKIVFASKAWAQYQDWIESGDPAFGRLNELIKDAMRSPFVGIGKPEPLLGALKGYWSRRITHQHRLVYRVTGKAPDQSLEILACRLHYGR